MLSYCVSLRSEFRVVMSVTISAYKGCSVRFYLQLFVRVFMSYLPYLCLLDHNGVQNILCCVFVLFFFVFCTLCRGGFRISRWGGSLKKNAPTGGRREHFWGISCEKITILRQKIIFFPILGGGGHDGQPPPPGSAPAMSVYFS